MVEVATRIQGERARAAASELDGAAMSKQGEWRLRAGHYIGEVSALSFLCLPHLSSPPYLLAGTGSEMLLFDLGSGKLVRSFFIFKGVRVHGICSHLTSYNPGSTSSKLVYMIAVFGETRMKLFKLEIEAMLLPEALQNLQADLAVLYLFPKFVHWVLDVCFLKKGRCLIAIGFSNNSICIWDTETFSLLVEVGCPDKCLLYSMRLRGEEEEGALFIASGTIFNEIIIWKVVLKTSSQQLEHFNREEASLFSLVNRGEKHHRPLYESVVTHKLHGHEGAIFRIAWSANGSKLVSASDDRSVRVWTVLWEHSCSAVQAEVVGSDSDGSVLFGHNARVWDCSIFDGVITAGEDGTCRVWGSGGEQLRIIKEHIGRGIWRCLYYPSSLLVTAGFDSAIKVHFLQNPLPCGTSSFDEEKKLTNCHAALFTISIPDPSNHAQLMDSKSEYVRCLHLAHADLLYVATNRGYLYRAMLLMSKGARWTQIFKVCDSAPIICMDILDDKSDELSGEAESWIAIGDGKGRMTVLQVSQNHCSATVSTTYSWSAEGERRLLGAYWCQALGYRYTFTSDPRGVLKSWRLCDDVVMHREFVSCFGARIMCLDASLENEVLVCGDLRGNVLLFPLLNSLEDTTADVLVPPLSYFRGAHGISSICRIAIIEYCSDKIEICSAGGDGCICYMEYEKGTKNMEFVGMKHVNELSLIEDISPDPSSVHWQSYAVGFHSSNFVVWDLLMETKVLEVPCGGWRRPHSHYLSVLSDGMHAFTYVKDDVIYIYWQSLAENRSRVPGNLHPQFHGREVHSLCFIDDYSSSNWLGTSKARLGDTWIASGSEDGTVRLASYGLGVGRWEMTKLLGEHVGGSAIRALCLVTEAYTVSPLKNPRGIDLLVVAVVNKESPRLLISAGAKSVLTSWLLKNRRINEPHNTNMDVSEISSKFCSTISFNWLASDIPAKNSSSKKPDTSVEATDSCEMPHKGCRDNEDVNDWRYLSVTAFLVKATLSRISVCFIVVSCSDATLMLRALILPHRLWYDVASLVPLSSPVIALHHVVIPMNISCEDEIQVSSLFIVVSGSTDGSIMFWDLSESVWSFMQRVSSSCSETHIKFQKRPKTGRGSQGGRSWKLSNGISSKVKAANSADPTTVSTAANGNCHLDKFNPTVQHKVTKHQCLIDTNEIKPLHVFRHVHQSGVNSLHVGRSQNCGSGPSFVVVSGGDDQSLHHLVFELMPASSIPSNGGGVKILREGFVRSAHSAAIKGIWTDGKWVFSIGLDQRVRCWKLEDNGECSEYDHLIVSVPEPEALDARANGVNSYQIAVAGRGMQMVEFSASRE